MLRLASLSASGSAQELLGMHSMRFASQLSSALGPASCSSSLLLQHSISTATSSMAEKAAPKAATEAGKDGEPKKPKTDKKSPQFRQHMAEREQWRKQVAEQLRKWRGEAQVQFLASQRRAAQRSTEPVASKEAQQRLVEEAIRRAERDVERAKHGIVKAQVTEQAHMARMARKEARHAALLEASKHWVTKEQLVARINSALDNPSQLGWTSSMSAALAGAQTAGPNSGAAGQEQGQSEQAASGSAPSS